MKDATGSFTEACSSLFSSISHCCAPLVSCFDPEPRRCKSTSPTTAISWPLGRTSDQDLLIDKDDEKPRSRVVYDPPGFQPQPVADIDDMSRSSSARTRRPRVARSSKGSGWTSFSLRSRFGSDASRRPLISAPTDFRHVNSGSFQFPVQDEPHSQLRHPRNPRPSSFRPLELSMYAPDNHVSPMMPHFDVPRTITTPPPAYLAESSDEDHHDLVHQGSYSSFLSFHIPRKQVRAGSPSTSQEDSPPRIPPRAPGRMRANTSPNMESIKERVASAMIEMERLQQQIDDVMERQSIYVSSRPSTSHSMAQTIPDLEPMPSIPALPPAAPSFAERLNPDLERPRTAPIDIMSQDFLQRAEATASSQHLPVVRHDDRPLPPPLPLVLRPPLRKKKSFSRVSNWLFPSSDAEGESKFESITNLPRPVKGSEGFYQCVAADKPRRLSLDSINTVSTWYTDDEGRTVPTAWSPESTPVTKQDELLIERTSTFGKSDGRSDKSGVGIAF